MSAVQFLPGTGRWQRVSADGGVDSTASGPSTASGGPPPLQLQGRIEGAA